MNENEAVMDPKSVTGAALSESESKLMRNYRVDPRIISANDIAYAEMEYSNFVVREINVNGKPNGEYHVKPMIKINPAALAEVMKMFFGDGFAIAPIDPEGVLNLEYTVFIKTADSPMADLAQAPANANEVAFERANEYIEKRRTR